MSDISAAVVTSFSSRKGYAESIERAEGFGFGTWSGVLLAADYGVPQLRRHALIVGYPDSDPRRFFPPPKSMERYRAIPDEEYTSYS